MYRRGYSKNEEIYDQELMPLFGLFQQFMMVHMQPRCRGIPEEGTECKLVRMKMNLYPNQSEQVKHGVHNDIHANGRPRPDIITSVSSNNQFLCSVSLVLFE